MQSTKTLENKLNQIESYLSNHNLKNPKVSKVTVGWQLDHSLKVINAVIPAMQKSDKSKYSDTFTFVGKILLFLQVFPRGKAKAPSHLVATSTILEKDAYFKHPMFGNVNKKRALTFLNTHTKHHLKIVRRILK